MPTYAALLRGINLGNHNKLPMPALRELVSGLAGLGVADVATYLQSGNVVFASSSRNQAEIASRLEHAIRAELGLDVPVIVRSGAALARIVEANPFSGKGSETKLLVGFLSAEPSPSDLAGLMAHPLASAGPGADELAVVGPEVYLHCPNGYGRTKLTNAFLERRLHSVITVRNWRTVTSLASMTAGV